MYDINDCYKIIFEAMAENLSLNNIAERIYRYTKQGVVFISGSGRLMASAGFGGDKNSFSFFRKEHLSWNGYELFFVKKKVGKSTLYTEPIYDKKKVSGYVLLICEDMKDGEFFEKLGRFLAKIVERFFAQEQKRYLYNQSLRRHIIAWAMMEDDIDTGQVKELQGGKYMAVLFLKSGNTAAGLSGFLRDNGSSAYVYENEWEVRVLFCKLTDRSAGRIRKRMDECQLTGCVSELFSDWHLCRAKQHLLARIIRSGKSVPGEQGIRQEKEWFIPGIYSYATPLIEEAGLMDYSIQQLLEEDEEKHTGLYHTLKVYLICENNITLAAKKLHIHRNTLVYRLKQIEKCLEVDLNDTENSWDLLAFIMMHDMVRRKTGERKER